MKYIRHILNEMGCSISDCLRRFCGGLSPDARLIVILSMLLVFTVGNVYFTISLFYNWGREDGKKEIPELRHIDGLNIMDSKTENDTINRIEMIDSPIDIRLQDKDSINYENLISNEKRTRKNRYC